MPSTPSNPSASGFVVAGFLVMWLVGFYPLIASLAAMVDPLAAVGVLVLLPLLLGLGLVPLFRRQEAQEPEPEL
ncbi:MAG: hypothetical protein RMK29_00945 [Myxococcales bacterium]|nr:hypothetical protein [Myxococcota bacterium]MDW8280245.1 hypothetical protein [Myxococcales bacterium]